MKKIFTAFVILAFLGSCISDKSDDANDFFSKIVGVWKLNNSNTYEIWERSGSEFYARVIEIICSDTLLKEEIAIEKDEDGIYYSALAIGQNSNEKVRFKMTFLQKNSIQFENKLHDFPHRINYQVLSPYKFQATIAGEVDGVKRIVKFDYTKVADFNELKDLHGNQEQKVEVLMEQLVIVRDSVNEAKLMNAIWEFSRPECTNNPMRLHLGAIDSLNNKVISNLSKAIGDITVTLTLSNENNWRKTIVFKPVAVSNVYLLMRE